MANLKIAKLWAEGQKPGFHWPDSGLGEFPTPAPNGDSNSSQRFSSSVHKHLRVSDMYWVQLLTWGCRNTTSLEVVDVFWRENTFYILEALQQSQIHFLKRKMNSLIPHLLIWLLFLCVPFLMSCFEPALKNPFWWLFLVTSLKFGRKSLKL